jgi:uncharacterized membrane protein
MADTDATPATSGLSDNAAGVLAYITVIPAIIFLLVAPYNKNATVRFHAWQCIGLTVGWFACSIVLIIPILGWIIGILGDVTLFVIWIMCIVKASGGGKFVIPVIGALAEKQANA